MKKFISKFQGRIKAILSGFDRIVFKGTILPLVRAESAMDFFRSRGVLNKDFKPWVMAQSQKIVSAAERYAESHGAGRIEPIRNGQVRKEELARRREEWPGPRKTIYATGAIHKFAVLVGGARWGAVTHPGGTAEEHVYMDL